MREPSNLAAASCAANDNLAESEPNGTAWSPAAEAEDRFTFAAHELDLSAPSEGQS